MGARTPNLRISKAMTLACVVVALGASYAQNALSSSRDGSSDSDGGEVINSVDQKSCYISCVKRKQTYSDLSVKQVSVGDVLPDYGVIYYGIPLRYCAPFYRCVVIGEKVVIADPSKGCVVQVVE